MRVRVSECSASNQKVVENKKQSNKNGSVRHEHQTLDLVMATKIFERRRRKLSCGSDVNAKRFT